ncbi:Gfo/Idh/MocA family protein [Microbacterium sp.]|uniref:Gfo/Idh/MocA family protein n=1 Tax=Microbacterium sp. TaxID=51671 RepID=UPI0039E5CDD8
MIGLATIGTSMITGRLIDAVAAVDGIEVTTVFSRDRARGERYAREHGIAHVADDLAALLGSPAVDAVYLASPNGAHCAQARAALAAGRHVLVEKPAVATAAEWDGIVELARARGVVLLEAMRNVYDPGFEALRALLRRIGTPRRASLGYSQRSARYDRVLAGEHVNIFDPALAGGAAYDLGVYCIAAMVELFGAPERVLGASVALATGADGAGAALAVYPGLVVDLSYSKITASDRWNEVQGERGTLAFDHVARPRAARVTLLDGTTTAHDLPGAQNNLVYEVERFVALVNGADAAADHARTRETLRVVEAVKAAPAL